MLSGLNDCNDFNEIWNEDNLFVKELHKELFTALSDIHADI